MLLSCQMRSRLPCSRHTIVVTSKPQPKKQSSLFSNLITRMQKTCIAPCLSKKLKKITVQCVQLHLSRLVLLFHLFSQRPQLLLSVTSLIILLLFCIYYIFFYSVIFCLKCCSLVALVWHWFGLSAIACFGILRQPGAMHHCS